MAGLSYEDSKKLVYKGLVLLAVVTLIEVFVSLFGKGHIINFDRMSTTYRVVFLVTGFVIIALSLYKAYYIIFEFMHMGYEAPVFVRTVLLPFGLLIWAIVAFLWEGESWKDARSYVLEENIKVNQKSIKPIGTIEKGQIPLEEALNKSKSVDDESNNSHSESSSDHH